MFEHETVRPILRRVDHVVRHELDDVPQDVRADLQQARYELRELEVNWNDMTMDTRRGRLRTAQTRLATALDETTEAEWPTSIYKSLTDSRTDIEDLRKDSAGDAEM